jgi:hypothetical protein
VTIGVSAAELGVRLEAIEGARLSRELPPGPVVVALRSAADRPRLAALPGVTAVVPDRLEHPTGAPDPPRMPEGPGTRRAPPRGQVIRSR